MTDCKLKTSHGVVRLAWSRVLVTVISGFKYATFCDFPTNCIHVYVTELHLVTKSFLSLF